MSPWTNKGKNTGYLVAPSKVTLVFELSTFDDFAVLDTTSCAQIFRGADQAGHNLEVDMQSHPHQIVINNLVAFIKRFLARRHHSSGPNNAAGRLEMAWCLL